MTKHLILYDGECGLCHRAVQQVIKRDRNQLFLFAPLQGKTAKTLKEKLPSSLSLADSLVLFEKWGTPQETVWLFGKSSFRILFLLGGGYTLLGLLSFLPKWLIDPPYRLVARYRSHAFEPPPCLTPTGSQNRFLP